MTDSKENLIALLVNQGLDGDMDSVNNCEDRMIRAKAKAMILKVKKGTIERPLLPKIIDKSADSTSVGTIKLDSLSKEDMIPYLVNQGLDGDMDAVNNCEDRMVRAKAKAMILKVKKGTIERPEMPQLVISSNATKITENNDITPIESSSNIDNRVKDMIRKDFPDSIIENEKHIQIAANNWYQIAVWLKSESTLLFDSLQCQAGFDLGNNVLESRYNLHSMKFDHYTEIRIQVTKDKPIIPSVEKIWRISDWFERETFDMFGIEFEGHRDLRRILLPEDWEGWPLRKDYEVQESYHGIVIPKMKEGWE